MISKNPEYADAGSIEDRLIEELSELIQIITKARRFGYFNTCPEGGGKPREVGKMNIDLIREEIADIEERLILYKSHLKFKLEAGSV